MDKRIENFAKFFHDQVRLSEMDYKSTYATTVSQLYSRGIITFGYISRTTPSGLVVIRFPRNHAPRLKVLKNIVLVTKNARREVGNSIKDWQITLEQFISNGSYHGSYSDLIPQYYQYDAKGYDAIACGGISLKLYQLIESSLSKGKELTAIVFDPFPPVDYYLNLENFLSLHSDNKELYLEPKIRYEEWKPEELSYDPNNEMGITDSVYNALVSQGCVILQGPPGTGKSYTIANIISRYLNQGKSVCATTMANKGLIELIKQKPLAEFRQAGKISKTHLSSDEKLEVNGVKEAPASLMIPQGELLCATNYVLSGVYSKNHKEDQGVPSYDLVVIEEASQAFLTTIIAFKALGTHCLIVGDPMQLPPIINNSNGSLYRQWNVGLQTNGMETFALGTDTKSFRIMSTFRLTDASAKLTSNFYGKDFHSVQKEDNRPDFRGIDSPFVPLEGGGLYCCTNDFTNGELSKTAMDLIRNLISLIQSKNPNIEIAVITPFKDTVMQLQKIFISNDEQDTLTIETVDRIQGMTVDYTIFYLPGRNVSFATTASRFNVSTSRSKSTTLIISDVPLENFHSVDARVKAYLGGCIKISPDGKVLSVPSSQVNPKVNTHVIHVEEPIQIIPGIKVLGKIDLSKLEKPKKEIQKGKRNIYVIDTNVFVNCPDIISHIEKQYEIALSAKVIDELDHLKIKLNADGVKNVQKALRNINHDMGQRDIKMVLTDLSLLPKDFDRRSPDNNILTVMFKFKEENPILLTSDNGLQIKARGLGFSTIGLKEFLRERKY